MFLIHITVSFLQICYHTHELYQHFITKKMSFLVIVKEIKRLLGLYLNFGNVLAFVTRVHGQQNEN